MLLQPKENKFHSIALIPQLDIQLVKSKYCCEKNSNSGLLTKNTLINSYFSALKFVLQELSEMALRYVSKDLTECESLDDINSSRDADSLLSLSDYESQ